MTGSGDGTTPFWELSDGARAKLRPGVEYLPRDGRTSATAVGVGFDTDAHPVVEAPETLLERWLCAGTVLYGYGSESTQALCFGGFYLGLTAKRIVACWYNGFQYFSEADGPLDEGAKALVAFSWDYPHLNQVFIEGKSRRFRGIDVNGVRMFGGERGTLLVITAAIPADAEWLGPARAVDVGGQFVALARSCARLAAEDRLRRGSPDVPLLSGLAAGSDEPWEAAKSPFRDGDRSLVVTLPQIEATEEAPTSEEGGAGSPASSTSGESGSGGPGAHASGPEGRPPAGEARTCSSCGATVRDGLTFCTTCGSRVAHDADRIPADAHGPGGGDQGEQPPSLRRRRKRPLIVGAIAGGALLLVLVAVAAGVLLGGRDPSESAATQSPDRTSVPEAKPIDLGAQSESGPTATMPDAGLRGTLGEGVSVTIADKGFTESFIVAEAYAQALRAQGFTTEVESLASTEIADAAITKGDIDVYPEYTGTAYLTVLGKDAAEAPDDFTAQFEEIETAYADRGLTALDPAPYNNGNEVACTPESGITTLEQLGEESGDIVYSANAEHLTREDGLPLLEEEYGVDFKDVITVDISLRYQPVEDGKAQCVYAFGTDPAIAEQDLVVLEDGKGIFTGGVSYQNFPVVNTEFYEGLTEEQRTAFDEALNGVDQALSADAIRELIAQVDFDREDPADVAGAFLGKEPAPTTVAPSTPTDPGVAVEEAIRSHWALRLAGDDASLMEAYDYYTGALRERAGDPATWAEKIQEDVLLSADVESVDVKSVSADRARAVAKVQTVAVETGCKNWTFEYFLTKPDGSWHMRDSTTSTTAC